MRNLKGSILLVSMVLVLIMTIAGTTIMFVANGEEKLLGSYRQKILTFKAAETALLQVEKLVDNLSIKEFSSTCTSGLCFLGSTAESILNCEVSNEEPWEDNTLWSTSGKHGVVMVDSGVGILKTRYLVEFRCYKSRLENDLVADVNNPLDWAPYYRITVLQDDMASVARTMLQSTYSASMVNDGFYMIDTM